MRHLKITTALLATFIVAVVTSGCSGQSGSSGDLGSASQSQSAKSTVYWTSQEGGRTIIKEQIVTRPQLDAVLLARHSGAAAPATGPERIATAQQAVTIGVADWANACQNFEWFLVTSAPDGGGDFFCGHYEEPFTTSGVAMPFVPQWYDRSSTHMFSLCTSASNCFVGDGACSFTTNWLSVGKGFGGGNINPPSNVLFFNSQIAPLVC